MQAHQQQSQVLASSEFGNPVSATTTARFYAGLINGLIIDEQDRHLRDEIGAMDLSICVAPTLMSNKEDRKRLAQTALEFASELATKNGNW